MVADENEKTLTNGEASLKPNGGDYVRLKRSISLFRFDFNFIKISQ